MFKMPPKSWFSKKSRHLELFFTDFFFPSEKVEINWSKVKAQITTRPIFYTECFMEHTYFRISSTAVTTRKFFIQGTVPTCTYNTMNIYYTDVFFTNTCDRPYGVAQVPLGDYTTAVHPNLFPILTCSARTSVSIPIQSKLPWHHYCRQ